MIDAGITTLDNLNLPEILINLNLHYNSIHYVGDNLTHLFYLKYLDLSSNRLNSTLGLSFCLNLQVLNLASNQITRINDLEKLRYRVPFSLFFVRIYDYRILHFYLNNLLSRKKLFQSKLNLFWFNFPMHYPFTIILNYFLFYLFLFVGILKG